MGTLIPERTKAPTESSDAFLAYLADWYAGLEPLNVKADWAANGIAANNVAVFVVDMVNGFCHAGPLAGERVNTLIPPVRAAIEHCYALGVRHFLLPQDTHQPDALEFAQFGPHCVAGESESDTVPELAGSPAAAAFTVVAKNSLHPAYGTGLADWLDRHPEVPGTFWLSATAPTSASTKRRCTCVSRPMPPSAIVRWWYRRTACRPTICPLLPPKALAQCHMTAICCTLSFSITWRSTVCAS